LLDYYRGSLSARRLGVLVRQLPSEGALPRALNGGQRPWTRTDHLIADLWALWAKKDHPQRAEMVAKARAEAQLAKVVELRAVYEKRKRRYGMGVTE
jgi:hypothetical protein